MRLDDAPIRLFFLSIWLWFGMPAPLNAQPPLPSDWSFDTLKLKNGVLLRGLIIEESATGVRFQRVHRLPGRPTVCMTSYFFRSEIDRLNKLSDADREILKNRLKEIDPTGESERKRMESLELHPCDWNGKPKAGLRYDSDHFSLISNASDEIIRRAAVRLEQIYTAYASLLPPRHPGGKPTTIVLHPTKDDYQKMLDAQGWKLQNPAFFDPKSNRIVCGSNLVKLGEDLEKIRQQHAEQRADLDKREALLRMLYGKKPLELARHLTPLMDLRKDMAKADRHNDVIFDGETKRLFSILYHEAFHAYACTFVYPALPPDSRPDGPTGELPRWLNEGFAQVFENGIVEAGELRVDQPDRDRLQRAKEAVVKGELLSVKELLNAGPKQFLVLHHGERPEADRTYLAAWALSACLTFDRRLAGTTRLDDFVRSVNNGAKIEDAFMKLVGQNLAEFEKDFHGWLKLLQADRSLLEPGMKGKKTLMMQPELRASKK